MTLGKLLARQLSNPAGLVGRLVVAPLWNRRNAALNDLTLEQLVLTSNDRVLEVGFGGGYLLGRLATVITNGFLAGVDVSSAMVTHCERKYRRLIEAGTLDLKLAQAESLPFPDGFFTKVCSVNSIFYWEDATWALTETYRVLTRGGSLVLCFTNRECLEEKSFAGAGHGVIAYETDDVRQMITSAGFGRINETVAEDKYRKFTCLVGHKTTRSR